MDGPAVLSLVAYEGGGSKFKRRCPFSFFSGFRLVTNIRWSGFVLLPNLSEPQGKGSS